MKKHTVLITRILLFFVFVWLSRALYGVLEVDGCLDDGGAIDYAAGICAGSRYGQFGLISAAPYWWWLVTLTVPALIVWGIYAAILRMSRHSGGESA
jgi:hypothetical protein